MKVSFGQSSVRVEETGHLSRRVNTTPIKLDDEIKGKIEASTTFDSDEYGLYSATMDDGQQIGGEYSTLAQCKRAVTEHFQDD